MRDCLFSVESSSGDHIRRSGVMRVLEKNAGCGLGWGCPAW